ncbi:MAG: hypothetical protein Q7S33_02280 [Nanoarchaeota archaeon]|nr:hypothetical protein [Nanoarchaeota archaeon]
MLNKKLTNFLRTSLLAGMLTFSFGNTQAQTNERFFDAKLGLNYESSILRKIENVPLEIRTVDKKNSDQIINGNVAGEKNYEFPDFLPIISLRAGNKTTLSDNLNLNLGVGLETGLSIMAMGDEEETSNAAYKRACEWPIYDSPRYEIYPAFIHQSNKWVKPSIFSELEINVKKNPFDLKDLHLILGYRVYPEKIIATNGWNDGTKTDIMKKYELSNLLVGGPYITFTTDTKDKKEITIYLNAGLNHLISNKPKDFGNKADFAFRKASLFMGMGMYVRF